MDPDPVDDAKADTVKFSCSDEDFDSFRDRFDYALTWSCNPLIFRGVEPLFQFNDTLPYIKKMVSCCDFVINPELNDNGNVHYHGVFRVKDKYKWFKCVLPALKYNGFVVIKKLNSKGWIDYMYKDFEVVKRILKLKGSITPECFKGVRTPVETPQTIISALDNGTKN